MRLCERFVAVSDISLSCEFVALFESASGLCACVRLCTLGKDVTDTGSDVLRT